MLSYQDARKKVIEVCRGLRRTPPTEKIELKDALLRVLAQGIRADRDYPPFDRAARDGFAVRAADCTKAGATLRVIGEVAAGAGFRGRVGAGECVQIMTGAPVPEGADAVVMVEHTHAGEDASSVVVERVAEAGMNFAPRGSEARNGDVLIAPPVRIGDAEVAVAAQAGYTRVSVYRKPRVAILSTGSEIVDASAQPGEFEIRNGNAASLGAQVRFAGGEAVPLGNATDNKDELRKRIEVGLREDILVISGGVSAGKYDLVEPVLRELGAEFFFDAVEIRPGRPAVFAICQGKPVFGLPGNPVSTMVTFELFVAPALDILGGADARALPLLKAKLANAVEQHAPLTYFLPARLDWPAGEATVATLQWQGSGDIATVARGNCFLVVPREKLKLAAGEWVDVLPRGGIL
ncbi:MAG TPA: gephyrin-like molybdotransferase Glp [Candidatus Acidoferrales bacterium]|nr:gephyrin-like molybdotransferase Glp [Candidatus Acidoferrales bacterium]